jgi:hypothetical protein
MTERELQRRVWIKHHSSYQILLPNYTPVDWWECDLFGVTRAGYFHEYEIKVSVADFRADVNMRKSDYSNYVFGRPVPEKGKHDQLAQRSVSGPAVFWYCVPTGMLSADDVPEWAGLLMLDARYGWPKVIKQAPRLHRAKIDPKVTNHALSVCYFRYWHERKKCDDLSESLKQRAAKGE